MLLKSKVSVEQEVEINIDEHLFYKNVLSERLVEFIGVIEECYINIWTVKDDQTMLEMSATESRIEKIIKAYQTWEHISEEEFFEALTKAKKDFDFTPTYREEKARPDEKYENLKNSITY